MRPNRHITGFIGAAISLAIIATPIVAAPGDYVDPDSMYAALSEQPHETVSVGDATIDVVFADGAPGLDRARTMRWVRGSAASVATVRTR